MPTYFPSYDITGIRPSRWYAAPLDYAAITQQFEFEDAGKDFNEVAPSSNAPRRWEYGHSGLTPAQVAQFDTFFDTVRFSQPFLFTDKYGTTWNNVYIESYDRNHNEHQSWSIDVLFKLIGYGSVAADTTSPEAPTSVTATPVSSTSVLLSWDAAIDPDPSSDSTPPTVPTGLRLVTRTTGSITIAWDASTD